MFGLWRGGGVLNFMSLSQLDGKYLHRMMKTKRQMLCEGIDKVFHCLQLLAHFIS